MTGDPFVRYYLVLYLSEAIFIAILMPCFETTVFIIYYSYYAYVGMGKGRDITFIFIS